MDTGTCSRPPALRGGKGSARSGSCQTLPCPAAPPSKSRAGRWEQAAHGAPPRETRESTGCPGALREARGSGASAPGASLLAALWHRASPPRFMCSLRLNRNTSSGVSGVRQTWEHTEGSVTYTLGRQTGCLGFLTLRVGIRHGAAGLTASCSRRRSWRAAWCQPPCWCQPLFLVCGCVWGGVAREVKGRVFSGPTCCPLPQPQREPHWPAEVALPWQGPSGCRLRGTQGILGAFFHRRKSVPVPVSPAHGCHMRLIQFSL